MDTDRPYIVPHPTRSNVFVAADGSEVFRRLAASPSSGGYQTVKVGGETLRKHVLICETFHGVRPPDAVVRHLDGDPSNDHPENLCWGTRVENGADAIEHGRTTRGGRNSQAKITESDVYEIRARRAGGETYKSIAADYGVTAATVCDIAKGRTWAWLPQRKG